MRIAIVLGLFPVLSETFIVNHINALINSGLDVDLYAYNKGRISKVHESLEKHQLLDRVVYKEKMPGPKLKRFNRFLKLIIRYRSVLSWKLTLKSLNFFKYGKNALSLQLFFQSFWFLKKKKYDIIHVHFGPVAFHISKLIKMGFLKRTRLVVTLHGYDINSKFLNEHELEYQSLFSTSDLVLVNTKYSYNLVKFKFPSLEQIQILPVGLDTHFFSPENFQPVNSQTILFCGRLILFKAPDLVIKIFNELVKRGYKNIRLEIIGEGSLRNELDILINKLHLNSRVEFRGALSQTEIRNSMNKASLFLMPGIYDHKSCNTETQGLVIQEAQSMKLPVVISDAGGMKYGILKDKSGFIIEEGNINGFANAVEKILTNEGISKEMGEIGRAYVVQNYDNMVVNNKLLDKYSSLLQSKIMV